VPGGHLIYVLNGVAVTAPFDHSRLTVTGPPTPVLEDLRQNPARAGNLWPFAVSAEGSLVFVPGGPGRRALVSVDRHGVGTPLESGLHGYEQLRLSPDGQRLAITIVEPTSYDIWIYELAHGRRTRLTTGGKDGFPVWSPDGTRIAFASGRFGPQNMFVRAADGSGPTERLLTSDVVQRPSSWSPDGRMLTFHQEGGPSGPMPDIWTLSFEPPIARPMVQLPGYQTRSRISPDGRWLAYASEESGHFEIYVTSFPSGTRKSQVSSGGGEYPVWARSGSELFYLNGDKLMVVGFNARSEFNVGKPTLLFQARSAVQASGWPYDVSLDGKRFVMIQSGDEGTTNKLNVVLGWSNELTRRARVARP
jgi:hypothetical protein